MVDDYSLLPAAPHRTTIVAERSGYVTDLHAEKLGVGAMILGAGRQRAEDRVDHAVGVIVKAHIGEHVSSGDVVLEVHYRNESTLANALPLLREAVAIGDGKPERRELVLEVVDGN